MAYSLSLKKNQGTVLLTVLTLALLGAGYFFIYVPGHEMTVQERRFRCLQKIDRNIDFKIKNSISYINTKLDAYINDKNRNLSKFDSIISALPKTDFAMLPVEDPLKAPNPDTLKKNNIDSLVSITSTMSSMELELHVSRSIKGPTPADKHYVGMRMRFKFDQFIKELLPNEVFDNYILLINDKNDGKNTVRSKVVYETFPSGLSNSIRDSLLHAKNGIRAPAFSNIKIGGTDYKMFLQPVSVVSDREWIMIGLVKKDSYEKEKGQLPLQIVQLLLTIAIAIIITLPWIKLYHMGNKDKLTVADGIASLLVSMLLMSLLFFVIFKYSLQFSSNYKKISLSADNLSAKITKAFRRELDTAYQRLQKCDQDYIDKANIKPSKSNQDYYKNKLKSVTKGLDVHHVFWLNKQGTVKDSWTTDVKIDSGAYFGERSYFINAITDRPNNKGDTAFYLDQLVSRESGEFTTVISKKSAANDTIVAAIAFTAKSVDNVVMPDGYQFAIIDTTGLVLYHSRPERNLNENLLNEFADSSKLVSCLQARSNTSFDAEYYGKQCRIKIEPIRNLPYFTVIFEDKEYSDARDTEAYAFTLSMLICVLVFLAFQFCLVFFASSKRSFFKKQLFDTSWIGPKINSHRQYNLAITGNFFMMVVLILTSVFCSFLENLFILLFSFTFLAILLNYFFWCSYKNNPYLAKFKKYAIIALGTFVIIIDVAAGFSLALNHFTCLLIFETVLSFVCHPLFKYAPKLLDWCRKLKNKANFPWTYTHSFALMATTRLIITSGIPVAFFFIYSFNYEQHLDMRYRQLNFARSLLQKIPPAGITGKLDSINNEELYTSGVYTDGEFVTDVCSNTPKTIGPFSKEDTINAKIMSTFRLLNNNVELRSNNFYYPNIAEEASFNSLFPEQSHENYITETWYKIDSKHFINIRSADNNYPLAMFFFWVPLLLIITLPLFYYLIHNIIRRLFALDLPSTSLWQSLDRKLLLNNDLNNLLFILGSPGSGKLTKLLALLKSDDAELLCKNGSKLIYDDEHPKRSNIFIADMILISADAGEEDPDWKKCKTEALKNNKMVIINHFEYNIKDARANRIKLDFIESLMQKKKSKVIIISTVHPLTFLDSFNEIRYGQKTATTTDNTIIQECELERWQVLLGHFRIIIDRLESDGTTEPGISCDDKLVSIWKMFFKSTRKEDDAVIVEDKQILEKNILDEITYSHYLNKMQPAILNSQQNENTNKLSPIIDSLTVTTQNIGSISDSLIFKLQITSHYFYTYIWQSLTKEEKFLLYDLAEEGLVNPYDDYNLSMLISKGLIINTTGTLMLFNKGFRNFILTAIGNTELNRIKAQVKDNGNWGNLKIPLNLAIIAILAFLIVSQQESYTQVITYITALGAGVPVVLRLLSTVGNDTQKVS